MLTLIAGLSAKPVGLKHGDLGHESRRFELVGKVKPMLDEAGVPLAEKTMSKNLRAAAELLPPGNT